MIKNFYFPQEQIKYSYFGLLPSNWGMTQNSVHVTIHLLKWIPPGTVCKFWDNCNPSPLLPIEL